MGQWGGLWKQLVVHQADMSMSPVQTPVATQVPPPPAELEVGVGDGVKDGIVGAGSGGPGVASPRMAMSAQARKVSCGPQPSPPRPS